LQSTSPGGVPPTIARYRVVERIGHGAMGDVYEAVDEDIGRRVAIRVMPPGQDYGVTGQVTHPNVVTVFDRGHEQGRPYVVMELLDGLPLPDYLQRPQGQSLHAKTALMLQVCDGLRAAHDLDVVHGHLKPGHVVVQPSGVVKLIDLGLPLPEGLSPYASPEQAKGGRADQRSDIYSAAAVFHFMLSGRPPLAPGVTASEVPEALARVIATALDEDPDRRHQSVAHLRAEIDQARRAQEGDRYRVVRAALDRYCQIEELIDERRALARRLGLAAIERECDQKFVNLASTFPEFGRAGNDSGVMVLMDPARASAALTQLQTWHNEVLAELSVLQAANGGAS
jgi:serine/threonine protein kinase